MRHEAIRGDGFGRTFYRSIEGQGYAQPLVVGDVVLVATNDDWIYGLDAQTGDVIWSRSVGPPIDASRQIVSGCPNPSPHVGILGTPVVDAATGVAYFVAKSYVTGNKPHARFAMHAVNVATGTEQPGFPVVISGVAENLPEVRFDADRQIQRPGLAMVDGVVYAGFGGICDTPPYQGWIFGVSASGQIERTWAASARGGSIWQSGGGLLSDGPGQLIVTTSNGSLLDGTSVPRPGPGHAPPASLAMSVVRLSETEGALRATDFFSPWNNAELDVGDRDLASSAPMALPSPWFGTPSVPHLLVQDGKEGVLYLLDRDNLGGMGQGDEGKDAVVQELGPYTGVWDALATWPGDGGYVYATAVGQEGVGSGPLMAFSYSVDEQDRPRFALAGVSLELFGYGSGAPVVTSDGTTSGSATVWATWCPTPPDCAGAELRAYEAVPTGGKVRKLWGSPIGVANKFTPPGVGDGRVYVATRDGHLVGYGPPPPLRVDDVPFDDTIVGEQRASSVTVTASDDVTITGVSTDSPQFAVDLSAVSFPLALTAGESVTLPVTYEPTARGPATSGLAIETTAGRRVALLSGRGLAVSFRPSDPQLDFGDVRPDEQLALGVSFTNNGDVPLTLTSLDLPDGPFTTTGFPSAGSAIPPGGTVGGTVRFRATAPGAYAYVLRLQTERVTAEVPLRASIAPLGADVEDASFETTVVGQQRTRAVSVTARAPLVVDAVTASGDGFSSGEPSRALPAALAAGETLTVPVAFAPTRRGAASGVLRVSTSAGELASTLTGTGAVAALHASADTFDLRAPAGVGVATGTVDLVASGDIPLTVESLATPAAPFEAAGAPAVGTRLAPGDRVTVNVSYRPSLPGTVSDALEVVTEAGTLHVGLHGTGTMTSGRPRGAKTRLTGLRLEPRRIRAQTRARVRLTFQLANADSVSVTLQRAAGASGCGGRRARRCTRPTPVRSALDFRAHAGLNRIRVKLPALQRGSYRLVVRPRNGGISGRARGVAFDVV